MAPLQPGAVRKDLEDNHLHHMNLSPRHQDDARYTAIEQRVSSALARQRLRSSERRSLARQFR
jgi:hypothetical protein